MTYKLCLDLFFERKKGNVFLVEMGDGGVCLHLVTGFDMRDKEEYYV